ncbi:MAG: hypothetical protein QGF06_07855 [Acidimicrobiales bacterium]|jgi:hypothetical protein|nr:hypothetical protein [Acidimicrobiales bacterium]MDP6895301.1 hypothetical protein [Acidimicrobiales bacterium]
MKFFQIMEFTGTPEDAIDAINNYIAIAGAETKVKKATVCEDRDNPGHLLQVIEFDSYEDAMINNDLEVTKKASEEDTSNFGEVQFKNLNVVQTFDLS